ncbi:MAG: 16S rRNA (cytidine(1402)-2'-O)-methyltransferase [Candidatus Hydrogenedentes bacterium]|nr:16S rRNA (cytidine(1402)-2'-O)-methyltransferase [Candidatus Hydrogenedentota bacterium]
MAPGRLFVVATPIGNLEDITARAIRILGEVQLIAAEDTRHSRILLQHFGITTPLTSYHEHNEAAKTETLLSELQRGKDVALISDAGTPAISDPGSRIVRAAHANGVEVIAVPGPSAPVAALSASGLPAAPYTFHGFYPRKHSQATAILNQAQAFGGTHVFLESPQRLESTLKAIAEAIPQSEICVAREMTKLFESISVGTAAEMAQRFAESRVKGECVIVAHVPATNGEQRDVSPERLRSLVEKAMRRGGLSRRDAIRQIAAELNVPRNLVYAAATDSQ